MAYRLTACRTSVALNRRLFVDMVQQHKQRKATLAVVRSTDKLGLALAVAAAAAYYLGARSRGDEHGREETMMAMRVVGRETPKSTLGQEKPVAEKEG